MCSSIDFLERDRDLGWVDGHRFCAVVSLIDPYQPICQFKHVVSQRNDDELGVFCPFLKINKIKLRMH